jgi:hypothetical protein
MFWLIAACTVVDVAAMAVTRVIPVTTATTSALPHQEVEQPDANQKPNDV